MTLSFTVYLKKVLNISHTTTIEAIIFARKGELLSQELKMTTIVVRTFI